MPERWRALPRRALFVGISPKHDHEEEKRLSSTKESRFSKRAILALLFSQCIAISVFPRKSTHSAKLVFYLAVISPKFG